MSNNKDEIIKRNLDKYWDDHNWKISLPDAFRDSMVEYAQACIEASLAKAAENIEPNGIHFVDYKAIITDKSNHVIL